jgi:hypothetical protein
VEGRARYVKNWQCGASTDFSMAYFHEQCQGLEHFFATFQANGGQPVESTVLHDGGSSCGDRSFGLSLVSKSQKKA